MFKLDDPGADLSYVNTRAPRHRGAERARNNCDELWRDFEPYADEHFLAEFPRRFHQRWFEMYLAVALLRAGLEIRCAGGGTPDVKVLLSGGRVLWIEATAPTGGDESNTDRVVPPPLPRMGGPPVAGYVPIDQVTMRVCGALHDKAKQLLKYRKSGIIAPGDQALVAVNVGLIPHGSLDAERYALGAAYGVGPQYVTVDRATAEVVDSGYQHRAQLLRSSGSTVDAAPFLHAGLEHVSGALISAADAANCPSPLGHDFMLLPNPNAAPTYSEGQLPLGREWRLEYDGSASYGIEIIEHSRKASSTAG